jgi:hypothetical protein
MSHHHHRGGSGSGGPWTKADTIAVCIVLGVVFAILGSLFWAATK